MADIKFYANENSIAGGDDSSLIAHTAGSGLGFFGDGFGISVAVGQYQGTTFVTNGDGTTSGIRCKNTKWETNASHPNSGVVANGTSVTTGLSGMPNYYAPLRVTFTHDDQVRVQNCKLRIFDRNDISKQASGVTTKVFECRHPHPVEGHAIAAAGTGTLTHRAVSNFQWAEYDPTEAMTDLAFTASPGMSGLNTAAGETLPATAADGNKNWVYNEGAAHKSTRHDWYVAMSASPDSIGSKTKYGLYFTLEYL